MSGRGGGRGGGRGHIAMTQAELTDLINTRVAEALAAYQAGQPANQNHPPACTYKMFMDCKPQTFSGTEGAVGLLRWFEKAESVFAMCNCPVGDRVKYATGTLEDGALTWWNAQVQMLGIEMANATTWDDFKELMREEYCPRDEIQKLENEFYNLKMEGSEIEAYTRRSNDLATLCPNMSRPPSRRIELYLKGLAPAVKGYVTAANLDNLPRIVRLAHKITNQEVERGSLPPRVSATTSTATATTPASDHKRKWNDTDKTTSASQSQKRADNSTHRSFSQTSSVNQNQSNNSNQGSYAGKLPKCDKCMFHHRGPCTRVCHRCNKVGHMAKDCRVWLPKPPQQQPQQQERQQPQQNRGNQKGCFQCGDEGHFKRDCPQLNQNANNNNNTGSGNNGNNGGNGARGGVYTIGAGGDSQ
ncbi:putative transcription factor interactor and regulator CCHC(Zn) family [Helianthus annuus]|nr:putative transcription factor interactor and regulator CCHC(Zn) family [Helianthus annuus]